MRTAEEIMQEQFAFYTNLVSGEKRAIISAINEARVEAIKECAENARADSIGYDGHPFVVKESIIKLLDQIK